MENMSLSDIAAVTRGNDDGDGWGGNGAWWIIVLFLFMFGAGWNRGGGANGEPVTEAGLCNAMNFNNLENAVGRFVYDSSTPAAVSANGNVPLPTSTVSNNCISCDGSNITINRCGVYEILANFTYTATVASVQETQMFRNGNAVPGAHALDTVATVGDNVSQAFHAIVTVPKNAPTATLNFKSANATSVRVANVIVVKVA
jgi:hypothetical protein